MATSPQRSSNVTNADLASLIGNIDTRLTVIEHTTDRIEKSLFGNGKPGFIEDLRCLDIAVKEHHKADAEMRKDAKERREKFNARTWAIVVAVVGAFITQTVSLIYLFIRTGTIH